MLDKWCSEYWRDHRYPKIIIISSIILLAVPAILSLAFLKAIYIAKISTTGGDILFGMTGCCYATNEKYLSLKICDTLGQFKFLLSIDLFF
jgi:hypothetical protein